MAAFVVFFNPRYTSALVLVYKSLLATKVATILGVCLGKKHLFRALLNFVVAPPPTTEGLNMQTMGTGEEQLMQTPECLCEMTVYYKI